MSHEQLTDEELVEFILESLEEDGRVRIDYLDIECVNGRPSLAGRVGSDEELELVDEIMNDVLNIHSYDNSIWVDDTLAFETVDEQEEGKAPADLEEEEDLDADEPYDEMDDEGEDKES